MRDRSRFEDITRRFHDADYRIDVALLADPAVPAHAAA